jgi:hypothetical protein
MEIGAQIKIGNAIVRKISEAQHTGIYKRTMVDKAKASADFRVTSVGSKNTIAWKNGVVEHVTDRKLSILQSKNSWTVDF